MANSTAWSAAWAALSQGDTRTLARLATGLVPAGRAHAAPAVEPDLKASASTIERVVGDDSGVSLSGLLDVGTLFGRGSNASCYGPAVA